MLQNQNGLDRETDTLGGNDPYSASKGCRVSIQSYYNSFRKSLIKIKLASARAGNVVGGGD